MGERTLLMTTHIYLIRHGESEWNHSGRYTGQQDIALSPLGRKQAEQVAQRLSGEPLAVVYTSPLRRARDTGEAVARVSHTPIRVDQDLAEINHGAWEGLTAAEVAARYPDEYEQWQHAPEQVQMPGGESLNDVARRCCDVFERLIQEHQDAAIAVCSHDAVIRVLLLSALDLPLAHFWKWRFENASISMLESHVAHRFRLALLNDTTHLAGARARYEGQAL